MLASNFQTAMTWSKYNWLSKTYYASYGYKYYLISLLNKNIKKQKIVYDLQQTCINCRLVVLFPPADISKMK